MFSLILSAPAGSADIIVDVEGDVAASDRTILLARYLLILQGQEALFLPLLNLIKERYGESELALIMSIITESQAAQCEINEDVMLNHLIHETPLVATVRDNK